MREQTSLEFDLTFVDVLLHKLVQAYFHMVNSVTCMNVGTSLKKAIK